MAHVPTQAVSSKPYLRKKAILVLYRVFLKFPDALRPAYPRLKEKIEDPDSGVQCAAISVICELARKNPKNYLSLAPTLFKIMTTSSNNWMLIKVIKLVGGWGGGIVKCAPLVSQFKLLLIFLLSNSLSPPSPLPSPLLSPHLSNPLFLSPPILSLFPTLPPAYCSLARSLPWNQDWPRSSKSH